MADLMAVALRLVAAEARADRAEQCAETEAKRADKAEAERDALRALVVRFIELCALGDVDETTEALGWGELIAEAKAAVSSTKGGGNG